MEKPRKSSAILEFFHTDRPEIYVPGQKKRIVLLIGDPMVGYRPMLYFWKALVQQTLHLI